MKCQILFSGKIRKNILNLSSAELAQRVVKVKIPLKSHAECKTLANMVYLYPLTRGGGAYCFHSGFH